MLPVETIYVLERLITRDDRDLRTQIPPTGRHEVTEWVAIPSNQIFLNDRDLLTRRTTHARRCYGDI